MSRRLRLGVVVPGWSGPGEEAALPALAGLLWSLARDHDLRIVALRHPARRPAYRDLGGVPVVALGLGTRGGLVGRGVALTAGIRSMRVLHNEVPFDVLHGFWADEPGAVAVGAARLLGRPSIVSVMGGELAAHADIGYGAALGRGGRLTVGASLRGADLVTVGSSWLFRVVAPCAPDVPMRLLPVGVDVARFAPAAGLAAEPRVLFVGSLSAVKDPVLLLRAFAQVRTPGAQLVVAGDGPLRAGLERLAAELGIAHRVRFLGSVPRADLPDVYRSARVLLVTSRHESQSMVAVEAAACGLAVVGMSVGVVPELAAAGGGVAVASRHPAALARAVEAVLDPVAGAVAGGAARAHAVRQWGLDGAVARLSAAWQELAGVPDAS